MRDVQKEADGRNIQIDRVGVKGVSYPVILLDRDNKEQNTVERDASSRVQRHSYEPFYRDA